RIGAPRLPLQSLPAHLYRLSADGRPAQGSDDRIGVPLRNFDQRERVRDVDGADLPRVHPRLVCDRPDQIGRPHTRAAAERNVEPDEVPRTIARASPTTLGSLLGLSPALVA